MQRNLVAPTLPLVAPLSVFTLRLKPRKKRNSVPVLSSKIGSKRGGVTTKEVNILILII